MRTHPVNKFILIAAGWPLISSPSLAQKLSIGIVTGTTLTGDFRDTSVSFPRVNGIDEPAGTSTFFATSGPRPFIIGPKLELLLPQGFSIEVDALHRPYRSKVTQVFAPPLVLPNGTPVQQIGPDASTETSWEIPLLGRYRVPLFRWHPFVEAGPSFRPAGSAASVSHTGLTVGGGVEWKLHSVNLTPGFRYTRWREGQGFVTQPNNNQVEFLVGVSPGGRDSLVARSITRRLSAGVLVGAGLGDDLRAAKSGGDFPIQQTPESNSLIAGILVEFTLGAGLSVEADGIYRPLHGVDSSADGRVRFAVLTWEFPVLLKYRFLSSHRARPFAELGPSFRADGNFNGPTPSHYGVTGGLGVEARLLGRLKISPALRYTRWARERFSENPFRTATFLNQAECLVGISF